MRVHALRRRPLARWTLRARVTATATLIVGALLVAAVIGFYLVIRQTVYHGLHDRGVLIARDLAPLARQPEPQETLSVRDSDFSLLQIVDGSNNVLAASEALLGQGALDADRPGAAGRPVTSRVPVPGRARSAYVVTLRVPTGTGTRYVYAGTPLTALSQDQGAFIGYLALVVVLATVAMAWTVWRSVRRALHPVRVMSAELAEITGGHPQGRVTVSDRRDEVAGLAESVNRTLRRLEAVVERQRAFVADASHELRSPLTGLRAELEVALEHPEDEDWPTVARAALGDADRLQRIVSDLLELARLDARVPTDRERVDLGALARMEADHGRRRVPVAVRADEGAVVLGTVLHLNRVLVNLLDNAGRHARSLVQVTVTAEGADAVLEVTDDGEGIAPGDRERIFRRFQRLPQGRERDRTGSGLGLAISRDIATVHGGELVAAEPLAAGPTAGGARLVLRLPLSGPDESEGPD